VSPIDSGISSLSTTSRQRARASAKAQAAEIRAWMRTWRCLGPWCSVATPGAMFCSDGCREASREAERAKRGAA
jgi:hypothetical protein